MSVLLLAYCICVRECVRSRVSVRVCVFECLTVCDVHMYVCVCV